MDNHFESEDILDEQKVKVSKKKLKGHALLWWDYKKTKRRKQGKSRIVSWDKMVAKFKGKFLPKDYEVQLYKKLQGLKQKDLDIKTYNNEFYKLSIRSRWDEDEVEKMAKYLGFLRFNIQDELVVANPKTVEDFIQLAIKVEEKIKRRKM